MITWLRQLFCKHLYLGQPMVWNMGALGTWRTYSGVCEKCGKVKLEQERIC